MKEYCTMCFNCITVFEELCCYVPIRARFKYTSWMYEYLMQLHNMYSRKSLIMIFIDILLCIKWNVFHFVYKLYCFELFSYLNTP